MKTIRALCAYALIAASTLSQADPLLAQAGALTATGWWTFPNRPLVQDHWIEEWDPVERRWSRVDAVSRSPESPQRREGAAPSRATQLARFGPFVVTDEKVAIIVGCTDTASPAQFRQMMSAFPQIRTLSFVDAPGTRNDLANLELGRMIRERGLDTHIPNGGSARSGAVELFLAGVRRTMEPGALFAVHSWRDSRGREPRDFAEDDPANRLYIDYYMDMGMTQSEARAFYAMTNSVPHSRALWLGPEQMRPWIAPDGALSGTGAQKNVSIAYRFDQMLDLKLAYGG